MVKTLSLREKWKFHDTEKSHTRTHTYIHKPPKIKPNTQRKNQTKKKNPYKNKIPNNTHKIPIHGNGFDHCLASLSTFPYWYIFLSYPIATKKLYLPLSLPPEHHLSLHHAFGVEGSEVIYNPLSKTPPLLFQPL